jgi:hypothetical protein
MKRKTTPRLAELAAAKVGGNSNSNSNSNQQRKQQAQKKQQVIELLDDSEHGTNTSVNLLEDDDGEKQEHVKPTKSDDDDKIVLDNKKSSSSSRAASIPKGVSSAAATAKLVPSKKQPPKAKATATATNPDLVDLLSSSDEEEEDGTPKRLSPRHYQSSSEESSGNFEVAQAPILVPNPKVAAITKKKDSSSSNAVDLEDEEEEEDDDDDEEEEEDEASDENENDEDAPPTTEQLQHTCWKCHVPLQHQQPSANSKPNEFCCYAMHTHPLLQVPACCVCSEQVAAVEEQEHQPFDSEVMKTKTTTTTKGTTDPEWCSGCGMHEDDLAADDLSLLLCDKNECRRAMCTTCVAQAHGGGRQGQQAVRLLILQDDNDNNNNNDDDASKWHCPICHPPVPLQALQQHLVQLPIPMSEAPERSLEDILQELQVVEEKKQECDVADQKVEQVRQEIRRDLMSPGDGGGDESIGNKELEELVHKGVEEWQECMLQHEQRLSDMVSSLHDELGLNHDIDLKGWYESMGYISKDSSSGSSEPLWKREADKDIAIRDRARKRQEESSQKKHNPVYDLDVPEEIEDLGSLPDEKETNSDSEEYTSQWRHCQDRATKESIEKALKIEDEELAKLHIKVESRIEDKDDIREIQKEEQTTSHASAGGRVRRDHVQHVQIRRKEEEEQQQQQQQRQLTNSGKSDNENKKPTAYRPQPNVAHNQDDTTESKPAAPPLKPAPPRPKPAPRRRKPVIVEETKEDLECIFVDDYEHLEVVAHKVALSRDGGFSDSSFVLSNKGEDDDDAPQKRFLSVAEPLAKILKPHQKEGIDFMFRNVFADLCFSDKAETEAAKKETGGCILAHNMGLGK